MTASRRRERLQDVPQQVDVVSGRNLQARNLLSTTDLQYSVPALNFTAAATSGGSTFSIRGIGTAAPLPSVEQSVGLNIDGVSIGIEGAGISSLLDINRVEVLEGPAGTLFGKNASAGLVTIYSNPPVLDKLFATSHTSYGSFNQLQQEDVVNIPAGDKIAIRLAALYDHFDGLSYNYADGKNINDHDEYAIRGRMRWQPTPQWRVDIIGDYDNNHSGCCQPALRGDYQAPLNRFVVADIAAGLHLGSDNTDEALTPGYPTTRAYDSGVQGEINYDPGAATLTSLSAYRMYSSTIRDAASFSIAPILLNQQTNALEQFSQEFRIASDHPAFDRLDYVAGLYYDRSRVSKDQILALPVNTETLSPVAERSYAAFGQATFHATDRLRLIAGGRYTNDAVKQTDLFARPGPNATPTTHLYSTVDRGGANASNFSYRFGVQYNLTHDIMAFATTTEGYKGPAYSAIPAIGRTPAHPLAVAPELSTEYEVGLRSVFLDHHVTLNLSAFDQKFENYQAAVFSQTLFVSYLTNAGSAETRGVEGELTVNPIAGLTVTGRAVWDEAFFRNYPNATCNSGYILNYPGRCTGAGGTINATGQPLPNAPRLSYNVVSTYAHDIDENYRASISVNWTYRSKVNFATTGDPFTIQQGYGLFGSVIAFGPEDGRWNLSLYGRNLLDRRFASGIQATPSIDGAAYDQTITIDEFRTVGLALDLRF